MSSPRAMRFTRRVRLVAFLVVIAGAWFSASVALAQKPSPGPSGVEAPVQAGATAAQPISLEDVPDSAETTHAELDAIVPKDAPSQMIERIGSELDAGNLQPARVAKEGWMKSL